MDERRKNIKDLEEKRRQNQESVNLMLADLGEGLLGRICGEGAAPGEGEFSENGSLGPQLSRYRQFLREIAESEEIIRRIEADSARLREIEEDIQRKEQQNSGQTRELSASYIKLGEIVLEEGEFGPFAAPYRPQAEGLTSKIRSLEERLETFEDKNGANVFAWISKNAQSMVIRSFLAKTQDNLRRLYASAGENFFISRTPENAAPGEAGSLVKDIEDRRKLSSELAAELVKLRGERRKIGDSFGAEGGPAKQIQAQEKQIRHFREELRALCLEFGEKAANPLFSGHFEPFLLPGDRTTLERAGEIRESIAGTGREIEKLKASLAVDDEKAEIERLKKTIDEYRERIAAAETAIAGLEGRIEESNRRIEELEAFLRED